MKNWENTIFLIWAWPIFILPMPLVLLFHVVVSVLPQKPQLLLIYRAHRAWIQFWGNLTGIRFSVHHHERVQKDTAYVFVVNHCNLMDIPIVGSAIIHPWKSLAKKEILSIPFLGWLIGRISITVDRKDKKSREESITRMVDALNAGVSILVFPEGTRNRTDNPLKDFHLGAFRVAAKAQVPIIPIVLTNTRSLQPVNTLRFYPGKGDMTFLPPISSEGYTLETASFLKDKVWEEMNQAILERDEYFREKESQMG